MNHPEENSQEELSSRLQYLLPGFKVAKHAVNQQPDCVYG